jgi:tetratricopeptide (TPR) repeat protein
MAGCTSFTSSQAETHYNKGNYLSDAGKYDEAIVEYTKAIELNQNYAKAYNNRGSAYSRKNQHDLAIADYSKAIEIEPNYALAWSNRGLAYLNIKQYELAIKDLTQAIGLDPNNTTSYNARASAYLNTKQYELAVRDLKQSIKLEPNQVQVQKSLDNAERMLASSGGGISGGGIVIKTLTGEWVSHGSNVMFEQANYFYYDIVLSIVEDTSGNLKGTWTQTLLDTTVKMSGVTWPIGIPDEQPITGRRTGETVQLNYGPQVVRLTFTGDSLWGEQHYYDYGSPVGGTPTFYEELHPELGSSYIYWTYRVNLYRK